MRGPGNGGVGQDAADVLDGRRWCDLDRDMCLVVYGLAMRAGLLIVDTRLSFCSDKFGGSVAAYGLDFRNYAMVRTVRSCATKRWCASSGSSRWTRILQQDRGLGCPRDVLEPVVRAYTTMRLSGAAGCDGFGAPAVGPNGSTSELCVPAEPGLPPGPVRAMASGMSSVA